MRILLIEDDRALCTALLPALQAAGYTVDTCHDGADGKALLCGGAYDVCVLDRMLPGLDGLSLLRAARAKGCTTPVLMLTALSGINDRVDGWMPVQTITWASPLTRGSFWSGCGH